MSTVYETFPVPVDLDRKLAHFSKKQKSDLLDAMLAYAKGIAIEISDQNTAQAFEFFKEFFDADKRHKEYISRKRKQAGNIRWANAKASSEELNAEKSVSKDEDIQNEKRKQRKGKESSKEKVKKVKENILDYSYSGVARVKGNNEGFIPPTVKDIVDFCIQNGLTLEEPQVLIDYYELRNWEIIRNNMTTKIKAWEPLVRQWARRQEERRRKNMHREHFIPPTPDQVADYCVEKNISLVSPVYFVNYYTAQNWKMNGKPIGDWRPLVENWAIRQEMKEDRSTFDVGEKPKEYASLEEMFKAQLSELREKNKYREGGNYHD